MERNMKTALQQSLQRRLSMTFSLVQALAILQMPQDELASWLLCEIEKNPLLELETLPFSLPLQDVSEIEALPSLYDHLMAQIRERFSDPEERFYAIQLLHHLDIRGFLSPALPDCPLLSILQSFDPPGIFARDLRECLMLQLSRNSSAFKIVSCCFQDLLHGRFKAIQKKTGIQDLAPAIQSLSRLHFRPAALFQREFNPPIIADLSIFKVGKTWIVESRDEEIPKVHLRANYLSLTPHTPCEKKALRERIASAKWLLSSLARRRAILLEIGVFLVRKQAAYLEGQGPLQPLSVKLLAENMHLHESTLSRALANKYVRTPRGVIPLRSLLSGSSETAKFALQKLIAQEERENPLSDERIAVQLQKTGMTLSRRTVAKYRAELKISPASRRKYRL